MEKCAFKSKNYENGCAALDAEDINCENCSFYKTEEQIKAEAKLYPPLKAEPKCRVWTKEEEAYMLEHWSDAYDELAKHFGVSRMSIAKKRGSMIKKGLVCQN